MMLTCAGTPGDLVGCSDKQVRYGRLSYASGRVYTCLSMLLSESFFKYLILMCQEVYFESEILCRISVLGSLLSTCFLLAASLYLF